MPSWSAEKKITSTICEVGNNCYICAEKGAILQQKNGILLPFCYPMHDIFCNALNMCIL